MYALEKKEIRFFAWFACKCKAYVTKSAVWKGDPMNASNPLKNVMTAVHTIPNQAAYGWNGACSALVSDGEANDGVDEPCRGEFGERFVGLRGLGY